MINLSENVACLGNRHFHFYIVGREKAAIIECAVSGAAANFRRQWQSLTQPQPKVEYLAAMHAHFDHVCGIPALKEMFPQAAVAASAKAQRVLGKAEIVADFFSQDRSMLDVLSREGLLEEGVSIPQVEKIGVDYVLEPGQTLSLDRGLELEIIAAPGHSSDSLAAWLPADKIMFISDAAGFQMSDSEIFPIFFQSYPLYMETIKTLRSYPARAIGIPHETIWQGSDIELFYQRALNAAQEAFDLVRDYSEKGLSREEMHPLLFERYYRGDLRIYTTNNIGICIDLLIKRVQECL
jgi:glyoxylase-like metal-dependent hydrolase (beta-lactamase superfamily II)